MSADENCRVLVGRFEWIFDLLEYRCTISIGFTKRCGDGKFETLVISTVIIHLIEKLTRTNRDG